MNSLHQKDLIAIFDLAWDNFFIRGDTGKFGLKSPWHPGPTGTCAG